MSAQSNGRTGGRRAKEDEIVAAPEEELLDIRVKQSAEASNPKPKKSGKKLGKIFNSAASPAINAVKRPLSSLLRRRDKTREKEEPEGIEENDPLDDATTTHTKPPKHTVGDAWNTTSATHSAGKKGRSKKKTAAPHDTGDVQQFNDRSTTPDIPTLHDSDPTDYGGGVASAPSAMTELDNHLLKQDAFSTLGDIDLSILARFVCSEADVRDSDIPWTCDYLYTNINSELRSGDAANEEEEETTGRTNNNHVSVM